jgi:hypothetical protein
MTDQKIEIEYREQTPVQAHLYIIECQSLGGFSGSPVFFELNRLLRDRYFVTPEIYLGGVMKGHYKKDVTEIPSYTIRELNEGLALVTPCYLLNELLYTDAAIKDRNYRSSQLKSIK